MNEPKQPTQPTPIEVVLTECVIENAQLKVRIRELEQALAETDKEKEDGDK